MAAPIAYSQIDDKDLDDAALWAVIDSATTNSKTLAIKSPSRISKPLPPSRISRNSPGDGEVEHEPWSFRPPRKVPRPRYSSPEAHLSPQIGRLPLQSISPYVEVSPGLTDRSQEEKEIKLHAFSGKFPSVSLFKDYLNTAMAILEKTDYTLISGKPFIKKSGWRKISCFFNISFEIRDKNIEFDENRNVQRAEFVVRAYMQGGRFSDGWGSCERREKRFQKPNHDVPSTAETRAKNKACQDLLGIGEYRSGDMAGSVGC